MFEKVKINKKEAGFGPFFFKKCRYNGISIHSGSTYLNILCKVKKSYNVRIEFSRGEVMNGGFGMVLDGSEDAARKAASMLNWDVANGVARR